MIAGRRMATLVVATHSLEVAAVSQRHLQIANGRIMNDSAVAAESTVE